MESSGEQVKAGLSRQRLTGALSRFGRRLLDELYPPVCAGCGEPLVKEQGLCAACFVLLRPITRPFCPVLGVPFGADLGPEALSAEALADPPPFDRARASVIYGPIAKTIVGRLKYGDRPELAGFCARLMLGAGADLWGEGAILVPVPLHASRLLFRRYNQSMLLAQDLARLTGLSIEANALRRHRKTRQQVGLSGDSRLRNVRGAFSLHPHAMEALAGRRVVLIDDVYTTGATVKAATRALRRGGVQSVDVLTFARVVTGDDLPI